MQQNLDNHIAGQELPASEETPVESVKVLADFRHGLPERATVVVGPHRHVIVVRAARDGRGFSTSCNCPSGCAACDLAIEAVQAMAAAWARPRVNRESLATVTATLHEEAVPPHENRPYDGLARHVTEADLLPLPVGPWAYGPDRIRLPLVQAEMAATIWREFTLALDRLFGTSRRRDPMEACGYRLDRGGGTWHAPSLRELYRPGWEPIYGVGIPDPDGRRSRDDQAEDAP